jgi:hypothetical protein
MSITGLDAGIPLFGLGKPPVTGALVDWDGFDQLEKEAAVAFFSNKTWADVLKHLRGLKGSIFGADFKLEEWEALGPTALSYYLRAYLEFLRDELQSDETDDRFVSNWLLSIDQIAYMHKGSPLKSNETRALAAIVIEVGTAWEPEFENYREGLQDRIAKIYGALRASNSNL